MQCGLNKMVMTFLLTSVIKQFRLGGETYQIVSLFEQLKIINISGDFPVNRETRARFRVYKRRISD